MGSAPLTECTGLKSVITEDGVWRIRKREKVPAIEVFKVEETGHGDILSPAFVEWRTTGLAVHQSKSSDAANTTNGQVETHEPQ